MKNFFKKSIFFIYNFFSTYIENYFLFNKIENKNNKLLIDGFEKLTFINQANYLKYFKKKIKGPNDYLNKFIIEKEKIKELIYEIFIENKLCKIIKEKTGFNYSIDFFVAYQTLHIPPERVSDQIYANHWHRDKPFSKNTLKIIIPLKNIEFNNGGMEIVNKYTSHEYEKNKNLKMNFYKMTCAENEYLLFLPNVCLHRAGNPSQGLDRNQLMFQLNPSANWTYKKNLFELQFFQEPKFPFFDFFKKKIFLI